VELTADDRRYLARKLILDVLGRPANEERREVEMRAEQIRTKGLDFTLNELIRSKEAADLRKRRGW
jgi:hypothetical protein